MLLTRQMRQPIVMKFGMETLGTKLKQCTCKELILFQFNSVSKLWLYQYVFNLTVNIILTSK